MTGQMPERAVPLPTRRRPWYLLVGVLVLAADLLVAIHYCEDVLALLPLPDPGRREQADTALGSWAGRTDAAVYLWADISPEQRSEVERRIRAVPGVEKVFFESRRDAFESYRRLFRDTPEMLDHVTEEQLPESYRIRLADPARYKGFEDALCRGPVGADGRRECHPGIDLVVDTVRLVAFVVAEEVGDLGADAVVVLAPDATRWQRLRVKRRIQSIRAVRDVAFESSAQHEDRKRRRSGDDLPYPRNAGVPSFRVRLTHAGAAAALRAAVCHGKHIGECMPGALAVIDREQVGHRP